MQKAPILIILGSLILLVGFVVGYSILSNKNSNPSPDMITPSTLTQEVAITSTTLSVNPSAQDVAGNFEYFWGNTCPHCKNVADFIENWALRDKIKITKLEVYENQNNAKLLVEKAVICKIPKEQVAIPLLFTPSGKCVSGDQTIIEYFKKINL